jgi:hypothetical protein
MTFYSHPWDGPTKVVVEYQGKFFDVREGWGCHEGWTNDHIAIDISNDPILEGAECFELSDREISESYSESDLQGIEQAVRTAAGK